MGAALAKVRPHVLASRVSKSNWWGDAIDFLKDLFGKAEPYFVPALQVAEIVAPLLMDGAPGDPIVDVMYLRSQLAPFLKQIR